MSEKLYDFGFSEYHALIKKNKLKLQDQANAGLTS